MITSRARLIAVGFLALTVVAFLPRTPQPPLSRPEDTVVGADGIIGSDGRVPVSAFPVEGSADQAAVRAGLGATQRLSCGASASLVGHSDVIVFSAHQVPDVLDPDVDGCTFVVTRGQGGPGMEDHYPILLDTLDHGTLVGPPDEADDLWNADNQRDWAVARLARPVTGVVPYRLPASPPTLPVDAPVTAVSALTENWMGERTSAGLHLAQTCHAVPVLPLLWADFPLVTHLDCDVGHGGSGGAIVQDTASGHPLYVATVIAYTGNQCSWAGLDTCFSIARRLDADLIARIAGTTAERDSPEGAMLAAAQEARLTAARDAVADAAVAALAAALASRDDEPGHAVSALFASIQDLIRQGRAAATDALFQQAFRTLHDPEQTRPEWPRLLVSNGEALWSQHRAADAYASFHTALSIAPPALVPFVRLRMAQSTADPVERAADLRLAYLAGGGKLFHAAGVDALVEEVRRNGFATRKGAG